MNANNCVENKKHTEHLFNTTSTSYNNWYTAVGGLTSWNSLFQQKWHCIVWPRDDRALSTRGQSGPEILRQFDSDHQRSAEQGLTPTQSYLCLLDLTGNKTGQMNRTTATTHHNRFTTLFSRPTRVSGCQKTTSGFLWCKGRLTEADTPTIWLGATPSGLTSAHIQLCEKQRSQGAYMSKLKLLNVWHPVISKI